MPRTSTGLYVPNSVVRQEVDQANQINAEIREMALSFAGTMRYWTTEYQRELSDTRLEIVFMPPTADESLGIVPGRYHLVRRNEPPTPPSLIPIEGDSGEFVEPGSWHIERMRGSDLQNPQLMHAVRQRKEAAERAKEREKQRDDDERMEHLRDAYKARFSTSVSLNRSTPWSQNVKGKKTRQKESK